MIPEALLPSKAQMQAGTDNTTAVTPVRVNDSDGVAKAWVKFAGASGSVLVSKNVTSVARSGTGAYIVNFTVGFAGADYVVNPATNQIGTIATAGTQTAGNCGINATDFSSNPVDPANIFVAFFGRQ